MKITTAHTLALLLAGNGGLSAHKFPGVTQEVGVKLNLLVESIGAL